MYAVLGHSTSGLAKSRKQSSVQKHDDGLCDIQPVSPVKASVHTEAELLRFFSFGVFLSFGDGFASVFFVGISVCISILILLAILNIYV